MQITPVRKYRTPRLPTHEILDQHPELLRMVPKRWRSNPVVLSALAMGILLVQSSKTLATNQPVSKVAPIFAHGDGQGAYGCKAVNAQHYLTEDEARCIIADEAKRCGINFTIPGDTIPKVGHPIIIDRGKVMVQGLGFTPEEPSDPVTLRYSLELDGTDPKRQVSFEFVSRQDQDEMPRPQGGPLFSTLRAYDTLRVSRLLRDGIEKAKPQGYTAVFYDPLEKQAEQDLRAQVKDFIKWLIAQGAI